VIAAGGILNGKDVKKAINMGASGVQMGSRFVASAECDAPDSFKDKFVHSKEGDATLIKSVVGLYGRAIRNGFTDKISDNKSVKINKCNNCLKKCSHRFCILDSLLQSQNGDAEEGLVFCGSRVHEINNILPAKTIIDNIMNEYTELSPALSI